MASSDIKITLRGEVFDASSIRGFINELNRASAAHDDFVDACAVQTVLQGGLHEPMSYENADEKEVEVLDVRTEDARPLLGQEPKSEA